MPVMRHSRCGARHRSYLFPLLVAVLSCGGDEVTDPVDVTFGETTFVVIANPVVNDLNASAMPTPGSARSGIGVAVDGGPSGTTTGNGLVVLAQVTPGSRTISFTGAGTSGVVAASIADQDLREVAVATDGTGASVMVNLRYAFGGSVVEITPAMSVAEVNQALAGSNQIVFLSAGSYAGDLDFSGSNVTLFGEGPQGGAVTIDGNVTVSGSGNRLRGARITGDLAVPGSDAGISFAQVQGSVSVDGSDAVLLNNAFCGSVAVAGSGLTALDNAGMAPISAPQTGC